MKIQECKEGQSLILSSKMRRNNYIFSFAKCEGEQHQVDWKSIQILAKENYNVNLKCYSLHKEKPSFVSNKMSRHHHNFFIIPLFRIYNVTTNLNIQKFRNFTSLLQNKLNTHIRYLTLITYTRD